ncbi:hypothetical protein RRX38_03560 [Pseudomonas sp. DTU_2021_1001937_2_SI_NGA_ILE_001]|uniref:hypothetical protein n=1 Tax=Pseudomonas sp. DTU_2021_1001937_2_SI_NGA_ILE_001 TaxID=3077589 RepID=UPI0028FC25A5|nr:hypothetical protein [Pseudomonas sp. DTU_2021_1001937_2_SI_NGA_ILE_001]WNW10265.1 hypothetical protein RRX38_03560 [Pseudomonas sp. DTU_2021_1001937_2_SI_NGA_ILE_001]
MRCATVVFAVTGLLLSMVEVAHARPVTQNQAKMCRWGSEVAKNAQQLKLSGKTLWSTRRSIEGRQYAKPWMKKMAVGITEQTFASRSRMNPKEVKDTYYQGCLRHEMARR